MIYRASLSARIVVHPNEPPMNASSLIPMNPRDYLILFSLSEGERHGYGIVKEVEQGSGGGVRIDPANLYRAIKRMITTGVVEECSGPESGEDRRKYYQITPLGQEAVRLEARRLAELTAVARSRDLIPEMESGA
jgi:DNA-binding PadR family transcriptional regulator